jgi:hypothetical protein
MSEIIGFIFDVIFNLIGVFFFETPAWDFDFPDTRPMRILLSVIILAIGICVWSELR